MANTSDKPTSHLSVLIAATFPVRPRFTAVTIRTAGRHLKAGRQDMAVKVLRDAAKNEPQGDFRPPAKCPITAISRPLAEWPCSILSQEIQSYVFGMTEAQAESLPCPIGKEAHDAWFEATGIQPREWRSVQGLNLVFGHAYAIRKGVYVKAENRNKKRETRGLPPESVAGEDGRLKTPPAPNPIVYCYQQVSPFVLDPSKADQPLLAEAGSRLTIPVGQPGHIPSWQLDPEQNPTPPRERTTGRRRLGRRMPPVVGRIQIGDDFVDFDLRGLLRAVNWRLKPLNAPTPQQLLGYFSGDPTIDPSTNAVTFIFKEGVVPVFGKKVMGQEKAAKTLAEGRHVLMSVDLGANYPMAARATVVDFGRPGETKEKAVGRQEFAEFEQILRRLDEEIDAIAVASLSPEQQAEVAQLQGSQSARTQRAVMELLGPGAADLPWDKMSSRSTYIADALLSHPTADKAICTITPKSGKNAGITLKSSDLRVARALQSRLSSETRAALNVARWEAQRQSVKYAQAAKTKKQIARETVNSALRWAQQLAPNVPVVVAVENLDLVFFHNRGGQRVESGWGGFFVAKQPKHWWVQALHGAFTDLAPHRGISVFEVDPNRTSITCTACGYCDAANDDRSMSVFKCQLCGLEGHADLLATKNIERVVLTGKSMPRPERSGGASTTSPARTKKVQTKRGDCLVAITCSA